MTGPQEPALSRRERQIMDLLFRMGEADVASVRAGLVDPPSYSAVRATLRVMEEKGHVSHRDEGGRYVYAPRASRRRARRAALQRVVETFFGGDAEAAFAALLDLRGEAIEPEQLDRLEDLLRRAREEGR